MNDDIKKEEKENVDEILLKLQFYQTEKIKVHILLDSKRFYNGEVVKITNGLLVLNDSKLGVVPIPITRIFKVEKYKIGSFQDE